jgi:hypothetical protein
MATSPHLIPRSAVIVVTVAQHTAICVAVRAKLKLMPDHNFASSGLLAGVGVAVLSADRQGSCSCLPITAPLREWDGGSATTRRRVPRRSVGGDGQLRRGAAGPRGDAGGGDYRLLPVSAAICVGVGPAHMPQR